MKYTYVFAYKYKLRPSPQVTAQFTRTLDLCRELYNAGLQERKDAYQKCRVSLNYAKQNLELPAVKEVRPDVAEMYSQVTQDVLRRLGRTFDSFFRRVERGEKPGYPRFKSRNQYDSFTYPQSGFQIQGKRLYLSKIGSARMFLSRPIEGKIKTCTIKREADGWYVIFAVQESVCPWIPKTHESVGLDVGLTHFATLSNGEQIANPRFHKKTERQLKTAQRKVSRRKKGSNRRKQAVKLLAKRYQKITRQRKDFFYKTALDLVQRFDTIVVEQLQIRNMIRNRHLAKSIADAAWGMFIDLTACKAANAGKAVVKVIPHGTSQECLCGALVPKTLRDRWHLCHSCGLSAPRDHVSAQLILLRAGAPPAGRDFVGSPVEPRTFSPPSGNPTGF